VEAFVARNGEGFHLGRQQRCRRCRARLVRSPCFLSGRAGPVQNDWSVRRQPAAASGSTHTDLIARRPGGGDGSLVRFAGDREERPAVVARPTLRGTSMSSAGCTREHVTVLYAPHDAEEDAGYRVSTLAPARMLSTSSRSFWTSRFFNSAAAFGFEGPASAHPLMDAIHTATLRCLSRRCPCHSSAVHAIDLSRGS